MTPEYRNIPDWAQRERQADSAWIEENLDIFWLTATTALEDTGRGAIVVETTSLPVRGAGHPFGYFSQEQIEEHGDEDTKRMVAEYDPTKELVLVLLKPKDRSSTYRVAAPTTEPQDPEVGGNPSRHTGEPTQETLLEPPSVEPYVLM